MHLTYFAALALIAAGLTACHERTNSETCRIEGPEHLMPEKMKQVRLGMTKEELEKVLGPADYSPTDGLFYFSTGGDCPLEETDRLVSCGVVADFRDGKDGALTSSLQSCWWGGIGE